jgi:molybdopterin-guanine dinucleotide biosynthesis protein B
MIIGIYGYSKSGKTMLTESLTSYFASKGYVVATLKHVHKKNFSLDKENTDTWRHWMAGSKLVVMASDIETSYMIKEAMDLDDIIKRMKELSPADLILVEGFKSKDIPKIAVGDIEETGNTIFRYEDNLDEIIDFIDRNLQVENILRKLPGLDCRKCGMLCAEFAVRILEGQKGYQECVYFSNVDLSISVNEKKLPMGQFAKDIISKTIKGMVSSLKGVDESKIESIELRFTQ